MCVSMHVRTSNCQQPPSSSEGKKKKKVRALDMQEVAVFALWIPPRVRANTRALAGGTALNVHTAHCKKCAAKEKVNKPLVICLKREKRDIYK